MISLTKIRILVILKLRIRILSMAKANSKLNEILDAFDKQTEPITEHEIEGSMEKIKKEFETNGVIITDELKAEILAFAFIEDYKDEKTGWGTYFGPMMVLPNESGQMVEYPSIQHVSKETLEYWSKRTIQAKHPIFKSRYAGLVWDFSKTITNENPDPETARIVIDAIVDIAIHKFHKYETSVIMKLERALSLSLSLNDANRIKKIISTIISFEDSIAKDDIVGRWGFSYDFLMNNKKITLTGEQKSKVISDLEERLNRVTNSEKPEPFAAEAAAMRLAEYYRRHNQTEKVREVLLKYGNSFLKASETASPLVGSTWLQKVYSVYLNFGLKKEADSISTILREINRRTDKDLKQISYKFEIPKDKLDKYVSEMLDGNLELVLSKIAFHFIPKRDEIEKQVKELSSKFVIQYLVSTTIQDHKGRPVGKIGSIENDLEGHIIKQMYQNMSFSSLFLHQIMEGVKEKFSPSAKDIVGYLYRSPVFDDDKRTIIEKGVKFYIENDFITAVHLLIPQIEDSFRNLVEKSGGAVYKPSRSGGINLKIFDEILREPIVENVFDKNVSFYLRVLFTDPRGWNLRNSICHGLIPAKMITNDIADRVFHALLLLGQIKEKKESTKK